MRSGYKTFLRVVGSFDEIFKIVKYRDSPKVGWFFLLSRIEHKTKVEDVSALVKVAWGFVDV